MNKDVDISQPYLIEKHIGENILASSKTYSGIQAVSSIEQSHLLD